MKKHIVLVLFMSLLFSTGLQAASVTLSAPDQTVYENWLPAKDRDITVIAKVEDATSAGEIIFDFLNVTYWCGYAMNAGKDLLQDLRIYGHKQSLNAYATKQDAIDGTNELSQGIRRVKGGTQGPYVQKNAEWITQPDGVTQAAFRWKSDANLPETFYLPVVVTAEDYGAYGELVANFHGLRKLFGIDPLFPDINEYSKGFEIPFDETDNLIADAWEVLASGWEPSSSNMLDSEWGGNSYVGDGFVVFEEYRGFIVTCISGGTNEKRVEIQKEKDFQCMENTSDKGEIQ